MNEVRWERMFPDQLEEAFARSPVVYYPYGMCEPHGPQCAVGLDALKAHAICCAAARQHGGIVAPPDYWHIHDLGFYAAWASRTIGEAPRSRMSSLPPWQHFRNVLYHIRNADRLGFQAAILLTGHYGPNWRDLRRFVDLVQPHVGVRLYGLPDFEANQPGYDGDGGDHAGKVETSLLWALMPDCVDVSRFPQGEELPWAMGPDARRANRRIGERMLEDEVRWLGDKVRQLLAEYAREKPEARLVTYEQAERLWETVLWPAMKDCESMQTSLPSETDPPEGSVWRVNWRVPKLG